MVYVVIKEISVIEYCLMVLLYIEGIVKLVKFFGMYKVKDIVLVLEIKVGDVELKLY